MEMNVSDDGGDDGDGRWVLGGQTVEVRIAGTLDNQSPLGEGRDKQNQQRMMTNNQEGKGEGKCDASQGGEGISTRGMAPPRRMLQSSLPLTVVDLNGART